MLNLFFTRDIKYFMYVVIIFLKEESNWINLISAHDFEIKTTHLPEVSPGLGFSKVIRNFQKLVCMRLF